MFFLKKKLLSFQVLPQCPKISPAWGTRPNGPSRSRDHRPKPSGAPAAERAEQSASG